MQYFGWWADCPLDISACRAVYQVSYINLASKAGTVHPLRHGLLACKSLSPNYHHHRPPHTKNLSYFFGFYTFFDQKTVGNTTVSVKSFLLSSINTRNTDILY